MKRIALLLALSLPLSAQIPTPNQHLKLNIGADKVLADYHQIRDYFNALDKASPRVEVVADLVVIGEDFVGRSEERRVGKECRSRWSPYH